MKRSQPLLMQINALSFNGKKLLERRRKARNHTASIQQLSQLAEGKRESEGGRRSVTGGSKSDIEVIVP